MTLAMEKSNFIAADHKEKNIIEMPDKDRNGMKFRRTQTDNSMKLR
jgi:hypothetical protein